MVEREFTFRELSEAMGKTEYATLFNVFAGALRGMLVDALSYDVWGRLLCDVLLRAVIPNHGNPSKFQAEIVHRLTEEEPLSLPTLNEGGRGL